MDMQLTIALGNASHDVVVDVEASHTVEDLRAGLQAHVGIAIATLFGGSDSSPLEPASLISEAGIVSGDVLSDRPVLTQSAQDEWGMRLSVVQGFGVGASIQITNSAQLVGRASSCDLVVPDPQVSRLHFTVMLDNDRRVVVTAEENVRNPVRLNGRALLEPGLLEEGQTLAVGGTTFALRNRERVELRHVDQFGAIPFNRTPYFRPGDEEVELPGIEVPKMAEPRRFRVVSVIAPLIAGIGMAVVLGSPRYLLFAILSPVMAAANYVDQRWVSGRENREARERFEQELLNRRDQINTELDLDRAHRLKTTPDLEELAFRAETRSQHLWQRERQSPDFLELRVGVGALPSRIAFPDDRLNDPSLNEELAHVNATAAILTDVPVTLNLRELGAVALVGPHESTTELCSSLVVQASCLHSPEDLIVVGLMSRRRQIHDWVKWLPHARSAATGLGGAHVVVGEEAADAVLKALLAVAEERAEANREFDRRWPWMLVVLDEDVQPDASIVSRLLEKGPDAGVSVVWLCESSHSVPRQVQAECHLRRDPSDACRLEFVDSQITDQQFDEERLGSEIALQIARSLAALRDASATNGATSIPANVPLLDVLGRAALTPSSIAQRWAAHTDYTLAAPFGVCDTGTFGIDLVADGPHGLVGGTSGSGKSALLQSLLTGLVVANSPDRLNILFIDYKGGALSKKFEGVQHNVGSVTNLDALMANRALTSLLAELNRRMALFDGLDMSEMLRDRPSEAPPSLLLVVDEFASLVRALPEFVDGVVNIAETGRSLGIHLLLATQRPSSSINENIQQNMNLRIALRMLDSGESSNVLNAPDAAMIPAPLKGRAIAKVAGRLVPFQSAYCDVPFMGDELPEVGVGPFSAVGAEPTDDRTVVYSGEGFTEIETPEDATARVTQFDRVIAAVTAAGAADGRSPWRPPLPEELSLEDARRYVSETPDSFSAFVGVLDDPAGQRQIQAEYDLSAGPLFAFGAAGAGKSTLLRTVAEAALQQAARLHTPLSIVVFDYGSRALSPLQESSACDIYATSDDLDATTRAIAVLEREMESRRGQLGNENQANLSFPPVLVLVDGFESLSETLRPSQVAAQELFEWMEKLDQILARGRQYGIYLVATTSEPLRAKQLAAVPHRLVARQPGDNEYRAYGLSSRLAQDLELRPGQAIDSDGHIIQIAVGNGGFGEVKDVAEALAVPKALPATIAVGSGRGLSSSTIMLGVEDLTERVVAFEPSWGRLLVVGAPLSGKSTVLLGLASQMAANGYDVHLVGSAHSPLATANLNASSSAFGAAKDLVPAFESLATTSGPRVLIFDDIDLVDDRDLYRAMEPVITPELICIGSVEGVRRLSSQNPIFDHLKSGRASLLLKPEGREVSDTLNVRYAVRPGVTMTAGRGVLVADRVPSLLQCALLS